MLPALSVKGRMKNQLTSKWRSQSTFSGPGSYVSEGHHLWADVKVSRDLNVMVKDGDLPGRVVDCRGTRVTRWNKRRKLAQSAIERVLDVMPALNAKVTPGLKWRWVDAAEKAGATSEVSVLAVLGNGLK